MRQGRRLWILCAAALLVAGCGSGGDGTVRRGTIDGVVLSTVVTAPPVTHPPDDTDPDETDDVPGGTSGETLPSTPPPSNPRPDDPSLSAFHWTMLDDSVQTGTLEVPRDADNPSQGTLTLAVERRLADDPAHRIGSLLVVADVTGGHGKELAEHAGQLLGQDVLDHFDVVAWDLRGTGDSTPTIDCRAPYAPFFELDPFATSVTGRAALVAAADAFSTSCAQRSTRLLPSIGTTDSARDADRIRTALHEPTISFFGAGTGSTLGATWATMFPTTVRAAVFDGAADPTVGTLQQRMQQAAGTEAAFTAFLQGCSAAPACAFHNDGQAATAYDALAGSIGSTPLPGQRDGPSVTRGVLVAAVVASMENEASWPALEQALADAQRGDGAGLLAVYQRAYALDPDSDDSYDDAPARSIVVGCIDDPHPATAAELFTHEAEFATAAPRQGAAFLAQLLLCSQLPGGRPQPVTITGAGTGPIVVVAATGDPVTPLAGTRRMAETFPDGRLITVDTAQHTGYGVDACVVNAVDGYLVAPDLAPRNGLTCP